MPKHEPANLEARSGYLTAFLRKGLVPPPAITLALPEGEERGQHLPLQQAACARCHVPDSTTPTASRTAPRPAPRPPTSIPTQRPPSNSLALLRGGARPLLPRRHRRLAGGAPRIQPRSHGHHEQLEAGENAALAAFLRTIAPESEPAAPALAEPVRRRPPGRPSSHEPARAPAAARASRARGRSRPALHRRAVVGGPLAGALQGGVGGRAEGPALAVGWGLRGRSGCASGCASRARATSSSSSAAPAPGLTLSANPELGA